MERYTLDEAAAALGVTPRRVRRLIEDGKLTDARTAREREISLPRMIPKEEVERRVADPRHPNRPPGAVTVKEAALLMNKHPSTIRWYERSGRLTVVYREPHPKGAIFYDADEVASLREELTEG